MVEVELGAAQQQQHLQQHYSASEAILIYNQQLHADQSANAIAGETSSSGRRADGRCGPHSVELSTSASQPCAEACVLVCAAGCARYARSRKLSLALLHACNKRTYGRPLELGQPAHGVQEIPTACNFLGFGQQPSASVRAVDADGRYRPCSLSKSARSAALRMPVPQSLRLSGGEGAGVEQH